MQHGLSRVELEIAMNLRSQGLRFSMLVMDEDQPDDMPQGSYRIHITATDGEQIIVDAARSGNDGDYVLYKISIVGGEPRFPDGASLQKLTPARG